MAPYRGPILAARSQCQPWNQSRILAESWHLQNTKMDDIIKMVSKFGPGALMAKFDIESAYRNIAIHPFRPPSIGLEVAQCLLH